MGNNRKLDQNKSEAKVPVNMREEFQVKMEDIYHIWQAYNHLRIRGISPAATVDFIKASCATNISNYFLAMGMELINTEIIKGTV
jgi:hypothetical protein